MAMTIPTIPSLPAGYIAQAADLNNLAYAAQFLLNRPLTRIHDSAGGQAIGTAGTTAISFAHVDYDNDSMYSSSQPTRLAVQTPGYYRVDYMISGYQSNGSNPMNTWAQVTTGSNNPQGSGVITEVWPGYGVGNVGAQAVCCGRGSGIIPLFMYAGDYVTVYAQCTATGQTTATPSQFSSSYLCLELVSI